MEATASALKIGKAAKESRSKIKKVQTQIRSGIFRFKFTEDIYSADLPIMR